MYDYHEVVSLIRIVIITIVAVDLSLTTLKLLMCFNEKGLLRVPGWNE